MEDKVFSPATETVVQASSTASEMTGDDAVDSHENASSKWTNEKHNSYLKSIEASFVDQLYNSLDMLSCQTQITNCSDAISSWKTRPDACISPGQYKVLRRGCWSKRKISHLKDADRPHVSQGYWIQHFRNASRKRLSLTAASMQYHVPHQHAIVAEVTDQNFDEDTSCSRKRVRTSKIGHESNDQVVPHCTSAATTENPKSYVSLKK